MKLNLVFISTMLPSGHFSQYFTQALQKLHKINLIVYTDKNPKNGLIKKCGTIKLVWHKNYKYIYEIIKQILKDKPDVIHIQQEFNMYGGIFTAILLPFLPLTLKILRRKIVVTIHAAVYKNQVDTSFISLFTTKRSFFITPFTLKLFFLYSYKATSLFADRIICHTNLLKEILSQDWGVDGKKISVIPTGIPTKKIKKIKKENYFFCFGYMVRRKGLEHVFEGFKNYTLKHPNTSFKLVLAGGVIPGQEKALDEIKLIIKNMKLQSLISVKGFIEEKKLNELYSKSYAVIIPAKVSMGSSGPLYQALSFGKCVLASNVGHFKEDLTNLKDGILVNNDQWESALEFAIDNPQFIEKLEKNVMIKAQEKSSENIAKKHLEVYREILNV